MKQTILNWLETGGLPTLFFLILLEGNPIIGSLIPGQFLLIFVGFIISANNSFNLYYTIIVVGIAAFLGDLIGFYMGKKLGVNGLKRFGFDKNNAIYKSSKSFFIKYGALAIILGRQFNPTRAFMPFLAGTMKMKDYKFIIISFISCFFWSALSLYLGYYFGNIILNNFKFIMEFSLVLIIYLALIIITYKGFKSFLKENIQIAKRYSLENFVFAGILFSFLIMGVFATKLKYDILINEYFIFLFISGFYLIFGFLTSKYFLFFLFFIISLLLLLKKEFIILIAMFWSLVLGFFCNVIILTILSKFYDIKLYPSVITFTFFIFYLWLILKLYFPKKKLIYLEALMFIIFIIMILSMFSYTSNLFIVLMSIFVGAIISEIILMLSNLGVIDNNLSKLQYL